MFDVLASGLLGCLIGAKHRYSIAATGVKFKDREFGSRRSAEACMYDYLRKNGLQVKEIYDDKHYKTYLCGNGIRFYINRV